MSLRVIELAVIDVRDGARCHCPCHHKRAPRLTDHVEAALCCDSCRLAHYEAEAVARCSTAERYGRA